ncbi:MAG: acyltransferase [Thermoleophilia bacterium]|nr:acyltransferase [Thermoleophilia bacterium]
MRRISAIDGVRGLAAMSVVAYHVWLTAGGGAGPFVSRGWAGVPVFFVISGFILYLPYARATFGEAPRQSSRPDAACIERPSLHIARRLDRGRNSEKRAVRPSAPPPVQHLAPARHVEHPRDGT